MHNTLIKCNFQKTDFLFINFVKKIERTFESIQYFLNGKKVNQSNTETLTLTTPLLVTLTWSIVNVERNPFLSILIVPLVPSYGTLNNKTIS